MSEVEGFWGIDHWTTYLNLCMRRCSCLSRPPRLFRSSCIT